MASLNRSGWQSQLCGEPIAVGEQVREPLSRRDVLIPEPVEEHRAARARNRVAQQVTAREDPVGERVQQGARGAAAEFVTVDGAAPGHISRVAGLGVGQHDPPSRRTDAIGAYY